ncbi:hypothetical protein AB0O05_12520 [Streptomyces sp. NPDC093084]|uniref:hypothetical protein n=1 Tax=Streptomyces sp. NPDC093084 TaxID=3155197 RepID=UPI00344A1A8A
MHAVTSGGRYALAGLLSGALVLTLPGTASASWPPGKGSQGNTRQSGSSKAGTLISKVTYSGSVRSHGSDTAVQPVGNWTPPACWYEPRSADEFKDYVETMYAETINTPGQANYAKAAVGEFRDICKDGKYKDCNTGDAGTYPASGVCTPNADGSIGEKYARGDADRVPSCGIRYLRSSGHGTYHLKATITWRISWNGSGGAGGDLPDGTFGTTQDIAVPRSRPSTADQRSGTPQPRQALPSEETGIRT